MHSKPSWGFAVGMRLLGLPGAPSCWHQGQPPQQGSGKVLPREGEEENLNHLQWTEPDVESSSNFSSDRKWRGKENYCGLTLPSLSRCQSRLREATWGTAISGPWAVMSHCRAGILYQQGAAERKKPQIHLPTPLSALQYVRFQSFLALGSSVIRSAILNCLKRRRLRFGSDT